MEVLGKRCAWCVPAGWLLALTAAVLLDRPVARLIEDSGIGVAMRSNKPLQHLMELPGEYWFTLLVMVAVLLHPQRWRASLLVFVSTTLMLSNLLIKWCVGRFRPFKHFSQDVDELTPFDFHPFADGMQGLLRGVPNVCLPSGHTALAFATAAALGILFPRGRWWFCALAGMVGVERVLENAHWTSDVVAAAALGVGGVWLVRRTVWDKLKVEDRHGLALPVTGDPRLQRAGKHPHAVEAR